MQNEWRKKKRRWRRRDEKKLTVYANKMETKTTTESEVNIVKYCVASKHLWCFSTIYLHIEHCWKYAVQ